VVKHSALEVPRIADAAVKPHRLLENPLPFKG
jgi:hypothetical protein